MASEDRTSSTKETSGTDVETLPGLPTPSADTTYPEGGFRAWMTTAGASAVLFATLGHSNAFGIFQAYYMKHQLRDETPDKIAWIGGTQVFLMFASGAVSGPMFDRYGVLILRPACIAYLFSVMMTSLCTKYWHFMLAQGILNGSTTGFLMFPTMSAVSQYFHARRGAALGCVLGCSSLGAIVFPVVLSELLNNPDIGFGWSVRACGFIMLAPLLFACFAVRTRLEPRKTNFFLWRAFQNRLYVLLIAASFFLFAGMFIPLFYLPVYAVTRGVNSTLASYLVAILNGASIFGRVIPGIFGDKIGRINVYFAAGTLTAICIFVWTQATSTAGIVVFAVGMGFTSGAIISGASVVFTTCTDDPKDIGTYLGMAMAIASLGGLAFPPANGALLAKYGGFEQVTWLSGTCCILGAALLVPAKLAVPGGGGLWAKA